ncbi:prolyl 3-hydroxylase 1 [Anoplophora glabripennis]|nr:prolyl 3-hydroxylase 1 [Anoplophora glabripennis]
MFVTPSLYYVFVTTSFVLLTHVHSESFNDTESCVRLYEEGVEAYLENRFVECVDNFEKALHKYRSYKKKLQNCRLKCKYDAELSEPLYPVDIENLLFYERAVKQTLCIMQCKKDNPELFGNFNVNPETEKLFEEQKPYEYLHICYFKTDNPMKAASSAFTYLVSHPEDKMMQSNLKHYYSMEEVNMKEIENFEAETYVYLYVHGNDAYQRKDWKSVEDNMEESLGAYLQAEEECRAQCEGPFDQGWYPDFIPSISNHFAYCLKCKQKCKTRLGSLNGEQHDDLLPSHYHYLQYAYFKMGNLRKACAAVASYLLFFPDDETMLSNMKFYSGLPKVQDHFFQPREEAIRYMQRQIYETRILKFINSEFKNKMAESHEVFKPNFRVTMTEKQLRGQKRFVSDGLATEKECRFLIRLAKMFAKPGDGYDGQKSPHTVMEKFEGITLTRVLFLVYFRLLKSDHLDLYLRLTEDVKKMVTDYFKLKEKLYFSYTQIVCRSAFPDSPTNRTDFSHEIHADNCNLLKDGKCEKIPPAYTWRDYSAILYLNSEFEGGEFIFSSDQKGAQLQSVIKPKCGRTVAFSSGSENLHGVKAVKKGSRCAIGIWFTHNEKHADEDRWIAYDMLENNINFDLFSSVNISNLIPRKT